MVGTSMATGKPNNTRTALILAALALGFFVAIMLKYWLAK
jgi:hypothetical protein